MATVLIPIPRTDFDPTETGVPWSQLQSLGHTLAFSTPDGTVAQADPRMLTGERLGILAPMLIADANGRRAYRAMQESKAFQHPLPYREINAGNFDALLLPGGHAPGMKPYLESEILQARVADFFAGGKPVAAICHGVLLAARSRAASGKSVLFGKRTTALTKRMEMSAWLLTCAWLGNYYRTYPKPVKPRSAKRSRSRRILSGARPASGATARQISKQASPCSMEITCPRAGRGTRIAWRSSSQRCCKRRHLRMPAARRSQRQRFADAPHQQFGTGAHVQPQRVLRPLEDGELRIEQLGSCNGPGVRRGARESAQCRRRGTRSAPRRSRARGSRDRPASAPSRRAPGSSLGVRSRAGRY